jgi:phosphoserine aminotransferase
VSKYVCHCLKLKEMQKRAAEKSRLLYEVIDNPSAFYSCPVQHSVRSRMNVPFRIKGGDEKLEKEFVEEANKRGLIELAGHRYLEGFWRV